MDISVHQVRPYGIGRSLISSAPLAQGGSASPPVPVTSILREHQQLRAEVARLHSLHCDSGSKYASLLSMVQQGEVDGSRPSAWIQREAKYRWVAPRGWGW